MIDIDGIFDMVAEEMSPAESQRLRRMLKRGVVGFKYKKKDGTTRAARGTLKPDMLPRYKDRRRARPSRTLFRYWDVDKMSFRSFLKANYIGLDGKGEKGGKDAGLDESRMFSGVDFEKSKPWTDEENRAAKSLFYETDDVFSYGYILPDGTRLDFSRPMKGEPGELDHYAIVRAFSPDRIKDLKRRMKAAGNAVESLDDMREEIKYEAAGAGLVRLYRSNGAYMVHVMQAPTPRQMDALYDMADAIEDQDFDFMEFYDGVELRRYRTAKDFRLKFMNDVRRSFS